MKESAKLVKEAFSEARSWREKNYDTIWDDAYRSWNSYLAEKDNDYPYRSQLSIPITTSTILTIKPRLTNQKPTFILQPREHSDVVKSLIAQGLIAEQWDKADMDRVIGEWVLQALIYGTSPLKVTWKFEAGKYDDPIGRVVDIKDVFVDPMAVSDETARYIIHRTLVDIEELENDKSLSQDAVKELGGNGLQSDEFQEKRWDTINRQAPTVSQSKRKLIEKIEYWTREKLIVCGKNGSKYIILKDINNPYKCKRIPFVFLRDINSPLEFYGKGEAELLSELQKELNDWRNQMMDNANMTLNRMFIADKGVDIDWETLESKPGGVILTSDINAIKPVDFQQIDARAIQIEQIIKSDMAAASGVDDYTRGSESGVQDSTRGTATGIKLIQSAANFRFSDKLQNLVQAMKEVGELFLEYNKQYKDRPSVIRIVGRKLIDKLINNEDLGNQGVMINGEMKSKINPIEKNVLSVAVEKKDFDIFDSRDIKVEIDSQSILDQETKRQTALQELTLLAPIVPNKDALLRDTLEKMGKENVEELMTAPPAPLGMSGQPNDPQKEQEVQRLEMMANQLEGVQ